jgi:hypothetical protein
MAGGGAAGLDDSHAAVLPAYSYSLTRCFFLCISQSPVHGLRNARSLAHFDLNRSHSPKK